MKICSVCRGLNNPNNTVCEHCGSVLIDDSESMDLSHSNNFSYLDYLIHSGKKEIVLDSDIVFSDDEKTIYENGIKLDVDDLVIDGNGHTVDACKKTRIFYCTGKNITIKNITLKNGMALCGGAIYVKKGMLIIEKSKLKENFASYGGGGAIHNKDAKLIIIGSELSNNNCQFGGAINNEDGEITITESKLNNNNASSGGAIYNMGHEVVGGLFYKNQGKITITESELSNNIAREWGGAIDQNGGELIIKKSTLEKNVAKDYYGGALNVKAKGELTIIESTLTKNIAHINGGAIYMSKSFEIISERSYLTIADSVLTKNTAENGGAIYIGVSKATIIDSRLSGNTAKYCGGAIYNDECEVLRIENCKLENNKPDIIYKPKT